MSIRRQFHGWTASALEAALSILTAEWEAGGRKGPLDLHDRLILVPTRHAGRRIRAELARRAAEVDSAVLTGRIVMPEHLLPLAPETADDALATGLLARIIMERQAELTGLLPVKPQDMPFSYALSLAGQIQKMRGELAEAGRTATDMLPLAPEEEQSRWQELADLEAALVERLYVLGRPDAPTAKLAAAQQSQLPEPTARINVLFIPDLPPLTARTLGKLAETCDITLHIQAPEEEAALFDDFGRPLPKPWQNVLLPIADNQIQVFEQDADETAALAGLLLAAENEERAATLCVPDPQQAFALGRYLQGMKRRLYLPHGLPLSRTAPGRLLDMWLDLRHHKTYEAAARFMRHPDAQVWLEKSTKTYSHRFLSELDQCQTEHLPYSWADLVRFVKPDGSLQQVVQFIQKNLGINLLDLLAAVYDARPAGGDMPEDLLFIPAAQTLAEMIPALEKTAQALRLSPADADELLSFHLKHTSVFPKPNATADRETIGWLDAQWETPPALVLADMREGVVPEKSGVDSFLPEGLRVAAGIPGQRNLLARDTFLARVLLASHPADGIRFLYSRRSTKQESHLPSRLLLACTDAELPGRVDLLFARPAAANAPPPTQGPALKLTPPTFRTEDIPTTLSVTDFKDYLTCPFRFYLEKILKMREEDDSARELDNMQFGTLAHDVLVILGTPAMHTTDEAAIEAALLDGLNRIMDDRFSRQPSLAILFQKYSLEQRLRAAAKIHAQSVADGWSVIAVEEKFSAQLSSPDGSVTMDIHARIDRIEQHEDGRIRILDYKTSDTASTPAKMHYMPKAGRWTDLQLPLYHYLYQQAHPDAEVITGYFNLPKAVGETAISELSLSNKEWTAEDFQADAIQKAQEVIADIAAGVFWPPAKKNEDRDDFSGVMVANGKLINKPAGPIP